MDAGGFVGDAGEEPLLEEDTDQADAGDGSS
jgi:hypothetical protein